jgi:dienelactone hydrolase
MRSLIFLFIIGCASISCWTQDITGDWNGVLKVQNVQLRLVFHIQKTASEYSATMDSPDQGAKGIPVTSVSYENTVLKLSVANAGIEYEGTLGADRNIAGTFRQMGVSFPLNLSRQKVEKEKPTRPQEPSKPYPYYEEEVSFENSEDGVTLAGTLTLPQKDGVFPAVVLISGSGAQNRDEELMGHKPFLVLADYLTRNGIAVLRYDDRVTGASQGTYHTATLEDFVSDARAAISYLRSRKEVSHEKTGLIGHSEGSSIAFMLAGRDTAIACIVSMAGSAVKGDSLMKLQRYSISKAMNVSDEVIAENEALVRKMNILVQLHTADSVFNHPEQFVDEIIHPTMEKNAVARNSYCNELRKLASPEIQSFLRYDPVEDLRKIKCPVLAINGEKDLQVPAAVNLEAIRTTLTKGGNKRVTTKEFAGLNHLFQECNTGLPTEYAQVEQTFSPIALEEILNWIKLQTKQ